MRALTADDLGVLLSFFVVLLIFFSVDIHLRRARHAASATPPTTGMRFFALLSAAGALVSAVALLLSWIALFLPEDSALIDVTFVFVPGSLAILCAVVLCIEVVARRALTLKD